jgi:hypothetical protein
MEERAPKRFAAESCSPLHDRGILQQIIDLAGPGDYIFLSTVSKSFRACYLHVPDCEIVCEDQDGVDFLITVTHYMTTCSAVLGSLTRMRLAIELGFNMKVRYRLFQRCAGNSADIETLLELHELHGMPYTEDTSKGAAASGSVSKLQWLLDEQHCPQAADICKYAVYGLTLDVLKWLRQRGCVLTQEVCTAAACSIYAASTLQYLHAEGVPFEPSIMSTAISYQKLPVLQWMYQHGCPLSKEAAEAAAYLQDLSVLSWLHSKGCPCDYEDLSFKAARTGYTTLLQWMKDNDVIDWSAADLSEYLNVAGILGHLGTAKVCDERHLSVECMKCHIAEILPHSALSLRKISECSAY